MTDPVMERITRDINARLAPIFREFEQERLEREERAAKADPLKHKLSTVMERGKPLSQRYWAIVTDSRGRKISYRWSAHRNVAGFYIGWREVETPVKRNRPAKVGELVSTIERDQFCARRVKKRLEELQKRRTDALRAKYPPKEPKTKTFWVSLRDQNGNGPRSRGLGKVRAGDELEAAAKARAKWGDRETDGWVLMLTRFAR